MFPTKYLPFRTYYTGYGKTHYKYDEVLCKDLTLNKRYRSTRFMNDKSTLFRNVRVVPFDTVLTREVKDVVDGLCHVENYSSEDVYIYTLAQTLKDVICKDWDSTAFHVVIHSSGYDSRILSHTIMELAKSKGDDWLGDIVFLCSFREGDSFKLIMEYEGWDDHQYYVVREGVKRQEYYAKGLLDFDNVWKRLGCLSAIPVNLFWYPVQWALDSGIISPGARIQMLTGQWGNTVMDVDSAQELKDILKMFYYSLLCQRSKFCDSLLEPFTSVKYARACLDSNIQLGKWLRPKLLQHMDSKLFEFENVRSDGDRHIKIADWILDRMMSDYKASWYGKRIPAKIRHKTTEFQGFYGHWCAASFCDYLIEQGCRIRM